MVLRPDEEANQSYIDRDRNNRSSAGSIVKAAGSLAVGAGAARVLPFLNEYIPADLAMKGLSKVSPKIADFLKRGQSFGLDLKQGMDYVKDQISPKEEAKEERNIIQQYSPELHEFISQEVKKGVSPIKAATMSIRGEMGKRFGGAISKMIKDHKISFPELVEQIYGNGQLSQQERNDTLDPPYSRPDHPQSGQQIGGQPQQAQQQSQQQNPGQQGQSDEMLLAALQKILQM